MTPMPGGVVFFPVLMAAVAGLLIGVGALIRPGFVVFGVVVMLAAFIVAAMIADSGVIAGGQ